MDGVDEGSGWVVLWSLKQGIEQLEGDISSVGRVERGREGKRGEERGGGGDELWKRAGWTFVFLRFGVTDAAEGVGHISGERVIGRVVLRGVLCISRKKQMRDSNVEDDVGSWQKSLARNRPETGNPRGELRSHHHSTKLSFLLLCTNNYRNVIRNSTKTPIAPPIQLLDMLIMRALNGADTTRP